MLTEFLLLGEFLFLKWKNNNNLLSAENIYKFDMDGNGQITLKQRAIQNKWQTKKGTGEHLE